MMHLHRHLHYWYRGDRSMDAGLEPGLFHFVNFLNLMNSIIFVLFGKYYLIVDQLGSKDSSRDFQLNCVISYFFIYI